MRHAPATPPSRLPTVSPDAPEALWKSGLAFAKEGAWDKALEAFQRALSLAPGDAVYLVNAAHASFQLGRMDSAVNYAEQALLRSPEMELAVQLKARALIRLQRHEECLAFLQALPERMKAFDDYWVNLGTAAHGARQFDVAIKAFIAALAQKMDDAVTHYLLGNSFYEAGLKEEAAECFRTALLLGLGRHALHVHGLLAFAERENCRWPQAREEFERIQKLLDQWSMQDAVMTSPFAHLSLTDDPMHHLKVSKLMANTLSHLTPVTKRNRAVGGRIRLGYLSSDFHDHATCVLMSEVFERHDRACFEVFAYSHGIDDGSLMRRRVMQAIEHFVDVRGMTDDQIAQRIADDGLDVLIDLKGYTAHHRLGIMARRPAPVQATFLGFPGGTGGPFMDYIIGDPVVTPLEHAGHFAEKIAQMPICYQPNDRQRPRPGVMSRADVGLPEDAVVLCGFNQAYKISSEVLDVWCELLRQLPEAVLWLLDWHGQARPNLEREIVGRGIDLGRVYWAPKTGLSAHISRIRLADVFLDTWPYNAHTTCSDALWAGVPVVTYEGRTFACRVASSLLRACQLPELVTKTFQAYAATVLQLVQNPDLRAQIRAHLDDQRERGVLFDSERFTRDFEALIARMVERARQGLPVEALRGEERVSLPQAAMSVKSPSTMKVAVVTPYHAESREWLERCIQSVQAQNYAATHFLVADGVAQDWIDEVPGVRHVKLGVAHRDYGNTPRAIGGLLAVSEGFDAVCFLDADNWYAEGHVQHCVATAVRSQADYVVSRRKLVRDDGSVLPIEYGEDQDGSHVDTNCYFLRPSAFHTLARWALAPKPMASLFDRFYLQSLQKEGLSVAMTGEYTVMYLCTWSAVYRSLGEIPPAFAKENVSSEPFQKWVRTLSAADLHQVNKLTGAALARNL